MAAVEFSVNKRSLEEYNIIKAPRPKRFKVSELPISSNQKSVIDGLVHTIKKKGIYDKLRHEVLAQYNDSVSLICP